MSGGWRLVLVLVSGGTENKLSCISTIIWSLELDLPLIKSMP